MAWLTVAWGSWIFYKGATFLYVLVTVFASVIVFAYVFEHKIMAENIGQMWRG